MPKISVKEFIASDPGLRRTFFDRLLVFVLLIAGVSIAGYFYVQSEKKAIFEDKERNLAVIAELKVNQISNWRYERMSDASQLLSIFSARLIQLPKVPDFEMRQKMFSEMTKEYFENSEYEGIYFYSKDLKEIAFVNLKGTSTPLSDYELAEISASLKLKSIMYSDLYKNEPNEPANLDIYAPLVQDTRNGANTIGIIIFRIDPNKFLFPFIQSLPGGTNKTFETLLVRKEGDKALFLNKLRFRDDSPLTFNVPLKEENIAAVMAIKGYEGITESMDYRHIRVLAATKSIPDTAWKLVAKIDADEVYAPLKSREYLAGLFVLGFIFGTTALLVSIWYIELAAFYRKQYDSEVERKVVAKRCDYLIKYANVIIINFNKELKIVEANDKAVSVYQYSMDEILKISMKDLQAPETLQQFLNELKVVQDKGSYIFSTINKRKDGSTFPVEMIMQHFVIEWVDFYQAIVRDLSNQR